MAQQEKKSNLLAKYGERAKKAIHAHADKPAEFVARRVPPGVRNGKARLLSMTFAKVEAGKQNADEVYYMARGVAVEPQAITDSSGNRHQVEGCQTSEIEMVCDTVVNKGSPKQRTVKLEEHIQSIENRMKGVMGDNTFAEFFAATNGDLEEIARLVTEQCKDPSHPGYFFHFETSVRKALKQGDEDGVWENWRGNADLEGYRPPEGGGANDQSALPPPSSNGDEATAHDEGPPDESQGTDFQLMELAEQADAKDKDAKTKLKQLALDAGLDADTIVNADSWADVAQMVSAAQSGGDTETQPESDEPPDEPARTVAVGENYKYTPKDAKGQPQKNARTGKPVVVSVEVVSVNAKEDTATVKNQNNPKVQYKGVPFSELVPA